MPKKKYKTVPTFLGYKGLNFGSDPEFFIKNKKSGKIVTADKLFPSKDEKHHLSHGAVFFDGVQGEINVTRASCREFFTGYLRKTLADTMHMATDKYELVAEPTCKITKRQIMSADPECRIFGCSPSKNAYRKRSKPLKLDGEKHLFRYAGGHVHLGTGKLTAESAQRLTKILDRCLGIPMILLDNDDLAKDRRKYYGMAGEYRTPSHGLEYRTLSNFWLRSPQLVSLVLGLARVGWTIHKHSTYGDNFLEIASDKEVQRIINETDVKAAKKLYEKMRMTLYNIQGPLSSDGGLTAFEFLYRKGLNKIFTADIKKNWKIKNNSYVNELTYGRKYGWIQGMNTRLKSFKTYQAFKIKFWKSGKKKLSRIQRS